LPIDGIKVSNAQALADNLQAIRDYIGAPIQITSWYRPSDINSSAGGSKTSQHLHAEAVDFVVPSLTAKELDDLFVDLVVKTKIQLPRVCTQVIRETKGEANWIHMGIRTKRWEDYQRSIIESKTSTITDRLRAERRIESCEWLRSPDGKVFEVVRMEKLTGADYVA
jgi:hypothetical protein